jgi:hypothetical protein
LEQLNKFNYNAAYLNEYYKLKNWYPKFTKENQESNPRDSQESSQLDQGLQKYHPRDLQNNTQLCQEELLKNSKLFQEIPKFEQAFLQIPRNIQRRFGKFQQTNLEFFQKLQKENK